MGNKVLIISPGTGGKKIIEDNDTIATATQPTEIDEIMKSLKTTIDNTSSITGDLAKIATNVESGKGTIGRLMMDKSWRQNIETTILNLKDGSVGFRVFIDQADELDEILTSLKTTIDNTSNITNDLAKISSSIESGRGTIGRLLMDPSSAQNIDSTFMNLKQGSIKLNELIEEAKDSWLLWGF
ncbi:MAG: hypothetical protein MZV65_16675 [Chromatiales bacterium]|nr:hypothetical protein [Chromatiales bacterium]